MSRIDLTATGAVILGDKVTCDGFHIERPIRIQTHWHSDHMKDFGPSKRGELVMTPETCDLLALRHPDLPIRANVHLANPGETLETAGPSITIEKSGHCLGAVQAAVQVNGAWLGYSGDFSWPLDKVIQVDELVVDATYGDPATDHGYGQANAEDALVSRVREGLVQGAVHVIGRGGTAERALAVLAAADVTEDFPVLAPKAFCSALAIHQAAGYPVPTAIDAESTEGHRLVGEGAYLRIWTSEQAMMNDALAGLTVRLTKYRARDPVTRVADHYWVIGISNHADYAGTMEFIARTGAKHVVTDGTRSSEAKARTLANAISRELGIEARAAVPVKSYAYGQ